MEISEPIQDQLRNWIAKIQIRPRYVFIAGMFFGLAAVGVNVRAFTVIKQSFNSPACTLEVMQCPDGSYVGKQGTKCEFADCPTVNTKTK